MRKLGLPQYLGYAAGDSANNLAFSMTTMFLLIYYTDVALIPAAAVGTILLVVRIWDAFADLFAGRMVDRTSTRWGKFRPFILFCSVPLLLLSVAVFSVPSGLSPGGKVLYAFITYAAFGLVYSLVNIPYGSLAAAMTQVPTERARLATFRVFGSNITILMLALVVSPQIEGSENLQRSLTITVLIFVVVGVALYLFHLLHREGAGGARRGAGEPAPESGHAGAQQAAGHALPVQPDVPHRAVRHSGYRYLLPTTPATCSATPTSSSS